MTFDTKIFWKNRRKATRGITGSLFNFSSRVLSGVLAGIITSYIISSPATDTKQIEPPSAAAIVGSMN